MALSAFPIIRVAASGGSDTAASGAPYGLTPVTGTAAAHTNGSSTTTITFTNSPDLSGVPQDGTALLWLATASGRRWSRINTVDNAAKTCVVQDSFNIASGSPVDYAIGGKRASLANSARMGVDLYGGTVLELENDETLSAAWQLGTSVSTALELIVRSSVPGTLRTINTTANGIVFDCSGLGSGARRIRFVDLKFTCSNATRTNAVGIATGSGSGAGEISCERCVFGDATNFLARGLNRGSTYSDNINCHDCLFQKCTTTAIGCRNASTHCSGCIAVDCGNFCRGETNSFVSLDCEHCLILGCTDNVFNISNQPTGAVNIRHNTISTVTGRAVYYAGPANYLNLMLIGNIIVGTSQTAIDISALGSELYSNWNVFYNNGSGGTTHLSGISAGTNDLLNVDPEFVNAVGGDYRPQSSSIIDRPIPVASSYTASVLTPGAFSRYGAGGGGALNPLTSIYGKV